MPQTGAAHAADPTARRANRRTLASIATGFSGGRADAVAFRRNLGPGQLTSARAETSARSAVQSVGDLFASHGSVAIDRASLQPLRRIVLRDFGHRVRINFSPQQEFSMANDRQSRQQSSERAQTSGGGAQQGEWQPSQRTSMVSQGAYPQESQSATRSNLARRRE